MAACFLAEDIRAEVLFDHSRFDQILKKYVTDERVDYASLQRERQDLDRYVASLAEVSQETYGEMSGEEKIAFWINAYNAITLKVIIDHYPIKRSGLKGIAFPPSSIRQIPGAWDKIAHPVMRRGMTLDDIEHGTLRKQFKEPRVHTALVCAAKGCPPLRSEAYDADRLYEQFADQARIFLSNPLKFHADKEKGEVFISPIFKWFADDFVAAGYQDKGPESLKGKEKAVAGFLLPYVDAETAAYLDGGKYGFSYLDYDWSLNERE
jgi:hypothetical protein